MINTSLSYNCFAHLRHRAVSTQKAAGAQYCDLVRSWRQSLPSGRTASGSPILLGYRAVQEAWKLLEAVQHTFKAAYRNSNPAVQSLDCINKTTPGIKCQSTHLQSRHPGVISLLPVGQVKLSEGASPFQPCLVWNTCAIKQSPRGLEEQTESTSPFNGH